LTVIILQLNDVMFPDEFQPFGNGGRIMAFQDRASGIQVVIPLDEKAALKVSRMLGSRVVVAKDLPPKGLGGISDLRRHR
jgi:methylthioribose-1-phosphate isomerase